MAHGSNDSRAGEIPMNSENRLMNSIRGACEQSEAGCESLIIHYSVFIIHFSAVVYSHFPWFVLKSTNPSFAVSIHYEHDGGYVELWSPKDALHGRLHGLLLLRVVFWRDGDSHVAPV
jgi:hypothetical protein